MNVPISTTAEVPQVTQQLNMPQQPHTQPQHNNSAFGPTIQNSYGEFQKIAGYSIQQTLGSGSFANVFKGVRQSVHPETQVVVDTEIVAIKAINRNSQKITKKVLQNLELEISILQTYRHPNIVCLNQVHKTDKHIFLFLEYCAGGDLQRLIRTRKSGRLTERLARRLMRDLTAGLTFLARQQLIHRDIKPQNLLLSGPLPLDENDDPADNAALEEERANANFPSQLFQLKIADFGFARHLQTTSLADTLCGSPLYMAPEILQHRSYDNKADLWSAGTVLFEMIAGRPPFHGENHIDLLRNIQQKAVRLPPDLTVSKQCVKLLRILLNRNPISRANFKDFIEASNAFVALGCNGPPVTVENTTTMNQNRIGTSLSYAQSQPFSNNLGPISEEETHSISTSTMTASAQMCSQMNTMVQQKQQLESHHVSHHNESRRQFSPLEPSPPGPKAATSTDMYIPPIMPLGGSTNKSFNNVYEQKKLQQYGSKESSQNSDDGEFVMVEKGSASTLPSPSVHVEDRSHTRSPISMWRQSSNKLVANSSISNNNLPSPPVSPRPNPSRFFSNKTILSSRNLIPPAIPFVNKGILSTSPGTGGALVGMMGNANNTSTVRDNAIVIDRGGSSSDNNSSSFIMPQNGVFNYELFARMLSAAEDVGRRAIHVAHVGDTRAYLAMKLMISNSNIESVSLMYSGNSVAPMEGVVEDNNCTEDGGGFDDTNSFSTSQQPKRGRAVSTDQSLYNDDDEDDEMPFVTPSPEDDNSIITCNRQQQKQTNELNSVNDSKKTATKITKASSSTIQTYFQEALSCYIKALTMLKGSVNASQRIIQELRSISGAVVSSTAATSSTTATLNNNEIESINQFKSRCEASNNWLVKQFKGVLERAEAGRSEISKLSSHSKSHDENNYTNNNSTTSPPDQQQDGKDNNNISAKNVEELIYNHSLACGREGAVKQLLGQHEASRACYRSAGLLIETLLMEQRLLDDDKKCLEAYVQGFAERISELDYVMLSNNSSMVASSSLTSSRRGSSIVPVIGGSGGVFIESMREM